MTNIPAPDLDRLRDQTDLNVTATTIIAVHIAYLTAAAVEDAGVSARDRLRETARPWLESYAGEAPITEAYLEFLRNVMGDTWEPSPRWQGAINALSS